MTLRASSWGTLALGLFLAGAARADDPKVEVASAVVLASNEGTGVDPPSLAPMKDKFLKEGFAFTSFKQLKEQKLVLVKGRPAEVKLPNGVTVTLKLEAVDNGVAKVRVRVPPTDTTYSLGREGSVFIGGGHHEKGTLVFVLSPSESAKHRRWVPAIALRPWFPPLRR